MRRCLRANSWHKHKALKNRLLCPRTRGGINQNSFRFLSSFKFDKIAFAFPTEMATQSPESLCSVWKVRRNLDRLDESRLDFVNFQLLELISEKLSNEVFPEVWRLLVGKATHVFYSENKSCYLFEQKSGKIYWISRELNIGGWKSVRAISINSWDMPIGLVLCQDGECFGCFWIG